MKILITEQGRYLSEGGEPVQGRWYILEDAEAGTQAQNRAFHALLQEYYRSGLYSWQVTGFDQFRDYVKRNLGAGFESYAYADIVDGKPVLQVVDTWEQVPEYMRKDPRLKEYVRGRLKSWTDYTKKERMETMDKLITEMKLAGVNSKKFDEILSGMEKIW